ncbi:MAG TPA: MFS transporter [Jiangellaceae bacterium]
MRTFPDVESVQRRTVRTLVTVQMVGGLGVATGVSVGVLLASQVLGEEDLSGLVQSAQVLGSALLAVPAAAISVRFGRRAGLATVLVIAAFGGVLAVSAAQLQQFWLLAIGMGLFGGGTTAGLQARYAAIDLAKPEHRGRTLSVVMWATTVGAVTGPNLMEPGGVFGEAIGVQPLAGPLVIGTAGLLLAAVVVWLGLRPDPLLLARQLDGTTATDGRRKGSTRAGLAAARRSRYALIGLASVVVAHTAMVTVMVMTPIHMDHGGASFSVIGFVISVHIAGMFAFSPVMGWLADRFGRIAVLVGGAAALLTATALAGTAPEGHSAALTAGLFLLGLGWSASVVAGSTLLSESVEVNERPIVQGTSDLLMGLAAAGGGALAGLVVGNLGYGVLNLGAAVLVMALLTAIAATLTTGRRRQPRPSEESVT